MTLIDTILTNLRRILGKAPPGPLRSPAPIQRLFIAHCRSFRELLTANHQALEAMAEMEQALRDGRTLSMTFIRAKATSVAVNVYKIVDNLNKISDGRYHVLVAVFNRLQQTIDALLESRTPGASELLILPLEKIGRHQVELAGEKMANLGEVGALAGMRIPPGFAITSAATQHFFHHNQLYPAINHIFQQMDIANLEDLHAKSAIIREMIRNRPLPHELETRIYQEYDALAATRPNLLVAVRSSALGEDLGQASFAGLYHTELQVDRARLVAAYKAVLASKYSPAAISYRLAKGYRHEETEMCVGCLAMIEAAVSGICYSRSVGGSEDTLDIFFAASSAQGIVDGTRSTHHFRLERTPPHRLIQPTLCPEIPEQPLTDSQAVDLAAMAMALENHFGAPQDIEWSIDPAGDLYILQSRPISVAGQAMASSSLPALEDERVLLRGGVTGCDGVGSGPVYIVRTTAEMLQCPKNAVLVVKHPLPEWAPLLKRAAALIAETGSAAGHLATLSREFGLPSLLALPRAIETLHNDAIVTVDAGNRVVYRDRIEELLRETKPKLNPMEGSPIQKTLQAVLAHIAPLHLLDPNAADFQPANCRTMHDITRFCHERSVIEMFAFGDRHHFDQGAAKRIINNTATQWWVINLEDGFHPEYALDRPAISVADIISRPMLALWEGMHAVPWEGPPPAPLTTMASFLVQSAMRPGLDPSLSSHLSQKNYFLISKNYCNLSVRLGYHYAMIEAMVGRRPVDRYITFHFKGGAAGEEQRFRRIELLADVLAKFDFRIDLIGDGLTARIEHGTEAFLYDRLKILGYLTIHTRQIDMVLTDARAQQLYSETFIQEIEEMLNHDQ